MSGLDRAFIRAYTKHHQPGRAMGAAHSRLAVGPRGKRMDAPDQGAHHQGAYSPHSPEQAPQQEAYAASSPEDVVQPEAYAPRSATGEAPASPYFIYVDEPHETALGPHWAQPGQRLRHPGKTTQSVQHSPLLATLSADWAGPAFEVDQFGWESSITELVTCGGIELDALGQKMLSATRGGGQVVAIGSAEPGAGGTTLLLCLAQRLAAIQLRAALVDADFAAPSLAQRLGMSPAFGWEDIATHERSLCDVLVHSIEDGITLLPLRHPVPAPPQLADDLYWRTTVDALRGRYRLVLLDVGVIGPEQQELPWLKPQSGIDTAIVVGREGDAGREGLTAAVRRLQTAEIDVLGVVENFCLPQSERLARRRPRGAAVGT